MVIGIDASRANRPQKTGIEWAAFHLLNAMKQIATPRDRFLLYTNVALRDGLEVCPPNWEERVLAWPPRRFWTHGRLSFEMLFRQPDLLFIPSHVIPVIGPKRTVLTCHDIGFERRPELYPSLERAYHRMTMRSGIRRATHIIAVSQFTKNELVDRYGVDPARITVIHHGFFGGGGKTEGAETALPASVQSPYALIVGRIEAKKNLKTVIDALALLRKKTGQSPLSLVMVGRPGFQYADILRHARQSPIANQITILPWVPSHELHALYRHASMYLFPSLYEGFGIPLLEAFSWGIPTIASDIPALREVGGDAACFAQPTAPSFAGAIEMLMGSPGLAEAYRKKGEQRIKDFSWNQAAQATLTVLQNAVK